MLKHSLGALPAVATFAVQAEYAPLMVSETLLLRAAKSTLCSHARQLSAVADFDQILAC